MFGLGKVTALKHPKPFASNAIQNIISYRTKKNHLYHYHYSHADYY